MKLMHLPNKSRAGFTIMEVFVVFLVLLIITMICGWCINIYKVFTILMYSDTIVWSGSLICRIIGIFIAPMGSVLGLFFW